MKEGIEKLKKRSLLLMLLNGASALVFLFSVFAALIPPKSYGYLSVLGLGFPIFLIMNLFWIALWLFRGKWRRTLISFVPLLCCYSFIGDFIQIRLMSPEKLEKSRTIKIVTYNVRNFGLYDWKNNKEIRDRIFHVLDEANADIVCFQEFFHSDKKGYFPTRDTLIEFLPSKFVHERYTHAMNGQSYFGVAMFSKFRMLNKGFVPFENDPNNFCIYADLLIDKDTVRVYDAHLQSIRFQQEDYAFVDQNRNQEELQRGSRRIVRRLKSAFQKRQLQVERVKESIASCTLPVILCGDFNDTPISYTYHTFNNILEDSFVEAGSGVGNTYIGVFPSFRIDYVFHSKEFRAVEYVTLPDELSDHHPVQVELAFANESARKP